MSIFSFGHFSEGLVLLYIKLQFSQNSGTSYKSLMFGFFIAVKLLVCCLEKEFILYFLFFVPEMSKCTEIS